MTLRGISTSLTYLARSPLYEIEKPYGTDFPVASSRVKIRQRKKWETEDDSKQADENGREADCLSHSLSSRTALSSDSSDQQGLGSGFRTNGERGEGNTDESKRGEEEEEEEEEEGDELVAIEATNHTFHTVPVTIHDARGMESQFSLDTHGFLFLKLGEGGGGDRSSVDDGSDNSDEVVLRALGAAVENGEWGYVGDGTGELEEGSGLLDRYYERIEALIWRNLGKCRDVPSIDDVGEEGERGGDSGDRGYYRRVEVIDSLVRKRDPAFPSDPGKQVKTSQPAALPHADFTRVGAFIRMQEACPGQEDLYKDEDFHMLNIWHPLHGPNNDWPLAVCDYRSIDVKADTIPNDVLHLRDVGEHNLLLPSKEHRWWYLSDQMPNECLVFRNTDSKGKRPYAFHAAFDTGKKGSRPRESIEVRLVAFH